MAVQMKVAAKGHLSDWRRNTLKADSRKELVGSIPGIVKKFRAESGDRTMLIGLGPIEDV